MDEQELTLAQKLIVNDTLAKREQQEYCSFEYLNVQKYLSQAIDSLNDATFSDAYILQAVACIIELGRLQTLVDELERLISKKKYGLMKYVHPALLINLFAFPKDPLTSINLTKTTDESQIEVLKILYLHT